MKLKLFTIASVTILALIVWGTLFFFLVQNHDLSASEDVDNSVDKAIHLSEKQTNEVASDDERITNEKIRAAQLVLDQYRNQSSVSIEQLLTALGLD
ncbi:hypothetical protein SAMN04488134_11441 [Amphibacillus marinus]|uniref:Uncharacterized protein n=1 Tax=Amphibacillus marinus TaxID=872970 RepID=A0A1H8T2C3_9BACI|nr:hypothetical protein [Amphibacillus marinus]SEO84738.1 hypothetical protein SAMN04488134_11441 [Amphibacillus marinus]